MADTIKLEKVTMDIVKGGQFKQLAVEVKKELDLNQIMTTIVALATNHEADSIIVPITIVASGKDVQVGTSKGFKDLASKSGINVIVKPNFNKGEDNMNKEEVKANSEVAAAKEENVKKPSTEWVEDVKAKLTKIAEDIKDEGIKIKDLNTESILDNMEKALIHIIERAEVCFEFESSLEPAQEELKTLKGIMAEAKENKWTETLKAIALWVCRKVWALVKGVGMFTWDTMVFTLNTIWSYGKGVYAIAEKDIVNVVKNA